MRENAINPIQDVEAKKPPSPTSFPPCNFYKCR